MREIQIYLTYVCNMNCNYNYCHLKDFEHNKVVSMPTETCLKAVDFFVAFLRSEKKRGGDLYLAGGEPLLRYQQIKEMASYFVDKYSFLLRNGEIKFWIPTNGILLDKEKFDYLTGLNLRHKSKDFINLGISFDGSPAAQERNRGKSDLLVSNLKSLKEYHLGLPKNEKDYRKIYLLWTLTPAGIKSFYSSFRWLFEYLEIHVFVNSLTINLAFCIDWTNSNVNQIKYQVRKVLDYINQKKINKGIINIKPFNNKIGNIKRFEDLYLTPCQDLRCMHCSGERLNILPNGGIIRCNFTFLSSIFNHLKPIYLGNVRNFNFDGECTITEISDKLQDIKKISLKEMSHYLKKAYKERVLNLNPDYQKSNKICFLRYNNQRSVRNIYNCQKAFLEEILNFSQNSKNGLTN